MNRIPLLATVALFCSSLPAITSVARAQSSISGRFLAPADEQPAPGKAPKWVALPGAVVYVVSRVPGKFDTPKPVEVAFGSGGFSSRIELLQAGQTLVLKNQDSKPLTVRPTFIVNEIDAFELEAGEGDKLKLREAEPFPCRVDLDSTLDDSHVPLYVVVREHPFMAVTDKEGRFKLDGLPPGTHELLAWHPANGFLHHGDWLRGRFQVTLKKAPHDLGELRVKLREE